MCLRPPPRLWWHRPFHLRTKARGTGPGPGSKGKIILNGDEKDPPKALLTLQVTPDSAVSQVSHTVFHVFSIPENRVLREIPPGPVPKRWWFREPNGGVVAVFLSHPENTRTRDLPGHQWFDLRQGPATLN